MATQRSGLFTLREFTYRKNVLKLAPDAYVVINGSTGARVVSPVQSSGNQDIDVRGGITSISVNAAVHPPGASRASLEVIAPQYRGLHEDYYITMPNGTKIPFFVPMMEIKIYMKGRFLERQRGYVPQYYPVFWGMITGVTENYTNGTYTFSITCEDFLVWWRYQKVTLNPTNLESFYGGAIRTTFPTIFKNLSAWEIIYALFTDSFFIQSKTDVKQAFLNFVYPKFSSTNITPADSEAFKRTFSSFAKDTVGYWNRRFGMGTTVDPNDTLKSGLENVPLEMYGLNGPISTNAVYNKLTKFLSSYKAEESKVSSRRADLDIDFNLLSRVQPYGAFNLYGSGAEDQTESKLQIATTVCERVNMEFFVDVTGHFVFKPPFYNLDVASGRVRSYRIGPEDIINFNTNFDSNNIINYLTVTGPFYAEIPEAAEAIGTHADFDSIRQLGIRAEQYNIPYGMNGKQLQKIAVAEMTRRNGQAYTGSVSLPLRPEIRLGYPVYLEHIDTFYYVTGVSHTFQFGASATTDLSLQYKRERIFEDGSSGLLDSSVGQVLKACVLRNKEAESLASLEALQKARKEANQKVSEEKIKEETDAVYNDILKQKSRADQGIYGGPVGSYGLWRLDRAKFKQTCKSISDPNTEASESSNELLMITDTSVPYTDMKGYRHIGAFPYGANLVLMDNGGMYDSSNKTDNTNSQVSSQLNADGSRDVSTVTMTPEESRQATGSLPDSCRNTDTNDDANKVKNYQEEIKKKKEVKAEADREINPDTHPELYDAETPKKGIKAQNDLVTSVNVQLGSTVRNVESCMPGANNSRVASTV